MAKVVGSKKGKKEIHVIDQEKCDTCGVCFDVCPDRFDAVFQDAMRVPKVLDAVESLLGPDLLRQWVGQLRRTEVDLTLPKFEIDTALQLEDDTVFMRQRLLLLDSV